MSLIPSARATAAGVTSSARAAGWPRERDASQGQETAFLVQCPARNAGREDTAVSTLTAWLAHHPIETPGYLSPLNDI
jgi:hypothetical protein